MLIRCRYWHHMLNPWQNPSTNISSKSKLKVKKRVPTFSKLTIMTPSHHRTIPVDAILSLKKFKSYHFAFLVDFDNFVDIWLTPLECIKIKCTWY